MPSVLKRSLIFILLMVAGLVMYTQWFSIKADRFDETAVPYLESALGELTSWQFTRLSPLLSPAARVEFETEEGQALLRLFSQLGQLKTMGKPQYLGDHAESSEGLGDIDVVIYKVALEFDSGPAVIELDLAADGKSYHIHRFSLSSAIFADQKEIEDVY